MTKTLFAVYLFFAVYCAGSMTVLQLQHFALYPKVGHQAFKEYLTANNRAAFLPAILPALVVFVSTGLLLYVRPPFLGLPTVMACFGLNLINLASSFIWQARIHGQLAQLGYDEGLVRRLIHTNWIRTVALLAQAILAVRCVVNAIA